MDSASSTDWIAESVVGDEAMRQAAIRACMEGVAPNRFLDLSPVDQRTSRARRLNRQYLKASGNCWSKPIQASAQVLARQVK